VGGAGVARAGSCTTLAWQLRAGSQHIAALDNSPYQTGSAAFTSISTQYDEAVLPQPFAGTLPGAANILVLDVCPLRLVDHASILSDEIAYLLVLDALTHSGGASASRISRLACMQLTLPGTDPVGAATFTPTILGFTTALTDLSQFVNAEPPLPAYAAPYGNPGTVP
jgi:hypothetical protein